MRTYTYSVLLAALVTVLVGCAMGTGASSGKTDTSTADLTDKNLETRPASFHPDSHFTSVKDLFLWVNAGRERYAPHRRACGHPNDHTVKIKVIGKPVFPLTFVWDDRLALRAQQEADRLARGGKPKGVQFTNQGYDPVKAWGAGYFTKNWMLTAFEDVTFIPRSSIIKMTHWDWFPLRFKNGMARAGLWYQDFFETGPIITRLGIGASATEHGTWWVLQFGV